jgi:hypothetical protein
VCSSDLLNVGTNTISVNVAEPAERFGGLIVYDSGSLSHQSTASLFWDSLNNHWVYQNASGSTYTGGMLMAGPRNTGSLGDEPSLTRWFVARSDGGDHLNNTQIYSSASIHVVTGSLTVTGGVTGSLLGTASLATTASYVLNAVSASFSTTASYVQTAQTASYVLNAVSASYALSATTAQTASYVQTAQTASYVLNAVSASYARTASYVQNAVSASYVTQALSSSFSSTASYVNTLNQSVIITSSAAIGTSSLGPSENTLTLGARDAASEGGQIGFNAPGGTYTSASFIDNWQNKARILKGNNTTSTGLIAQWDIHTTQLQLPAYTAVSSFPGTAAANLAVDSGGNVITVSTTGGSVFPYVGNAVITGSLTVTQPVYIPINGNMYLQGGDDAALYDVNIVNTMGIYGVQDVTVGAVKLGSNGPVLYGSGSRLGINTTNPSSASLTVNGNVWATSFTGSLLGTASYASQALSSSYVLNAVSASYALNATSASYALSSSRALSASFATTASYYGGSVISASYAATASYVNPLIQDVQITGSLFVSQSLDTSNRLLYDNLSGQSIDWNNRILYDSSNFSSVDWNNRILYDSSGISSVEWQNRFLYDSVGNTPLSYDSPVNGHKIISDTYYLSRLGSQVQEDFSNVPQDSTGKVNYEGEVIEGVLDGTVVTHDLVYLSSSGTWFPVSQSSDQCTKLLGICVEAPKSLVLLEGSITVTSGISTDSPYVQGLAAGLPIYIRDGGGTDMSTASPTNPGQYVRVLGHAYYNSTTYTDYWTMKFKPSNDWITI